MELGNPEGGAYMNMSLITVYLTYLDREKLTLLTQEEEGRFPPCPATTQPMRSCQDLKPWLSSQGLCSKQPLPTTSLPLSKNYLYFLDLPMVHYSLCIPNHYSSAIPK